jgi:hypothetical protein
MWCKRLMLLSLVAVLNAGLAWAGSKKECGLVGSIEDRIKDCHTHKTVRSGSVWAVVTRAKNKSGAVSILTRDQRSGLIWSDKFPRVLSFEEAQRTCDSYAEFLNPAAPKPRYKWFLPSADDYQGAEDHGIREVLDMKWSDGEAPYFWTSSPHDVYAKLFSSYDGDLRSYNERRFQYAVLCVMR